jgi:hypothetical protein
MNTPTLTGTYTCTHHNDQQRAACPVCLVATLTTERDHWQKIAVSASREREHNANVAQAMAAERDQLRARAELAEDNLAALEQCHDDNCRGVVKIADDLAAERARLDWLLLDVVSRFDDAYYTRATIDAKMKEDAK